MRRYCSVSWPGKLSREQQIPDTCARRRFNADLPRRQYAALRPGHVLDQPPRQLLVLLSVRRGRQPHQIRGVQAARRREPAVPAAGGADRPTSAPHITNDNWSTGRWSGIPRGRGRGPCSPSSRSFPARSGPGTGRRSRLLRSGTSSCSGRGAARRRSQPATRLDVPRWSPHLLAVDHEWSPSARPGGMAGRPSPGRVGHGEARNLAGGRGRRAPGAVAGDHVRERSGVDDARHRHPAAGDLLHDQGVEQQRGPEAVVLLLDGQPEQAEFSSPPRSGPGTRPGARVRSRPG